MKRGIFTPFLCIIIPFIKIPCPMGLQGIRLIPERVQVLADMRGHTWLGCWGIKYTVHHDSTEALFCHMM